MSVHSPHTPGTCDDVGVFYWLVKATLGMTLKIVFRPWSRDVRKVPRRGPVILASNHLSFSDHFFGPLPVPRKVTFLGKSEYFTGRGLKGLLTKAFFAGVGVIPIDRTGGEASERSLTTGLRVLAEGKVLGIYPEGTRSPDGRLYKGHTGVARLALKSGAPVLAVAMVGTREAQPIGQVKPNFGSPITIRYSRPMRFDKYAERADDPRVLRQITDEMMFELRALSGQEYVDRYAKRGEVVEVAGQAKVGSLPEAETRAPAVATA
jgi:1-acyl-sn-glycerol-3-phosphate acyltransferase